MRLSFWEHLDELRTVIIRSGCAILFGTLIAFLFRRSLFALILHPLGARELFLFSPLEGFSIALKLSFWAGLLLSSPFWLYFFLRFLLPALHQREKRLLLPFLLLSILFISGGVLFAYHLTLPVAITFFHQFNEGLGENLWGLGKTIDLAFCLLIAHGLVFELYVGLLFLIHFQIISYRRLKRGRRTAIVLILVLAALFTPPDILSQLLLALPMYLLYETTLIYAKFRLKPGFKRNLVIDIKDR